MLWKQKLVKTKINNEYVLQQFSLTWQRDGHDVIERSLKFTLTGDKKEKRPRERNRKCVCVLWREIQTDTEVEIDRKTN